MAVQGRVFLSHCTLLMAAILVLFGEQITAQLAFGLEVSERAWQSSTNSVGTTTLGVVLPIAIFFAEILVKLFSGGAKAMNLLLKNLRLKVALALTAWILLFSYHIYKVSHEITIAAESTYPDQPHFGLPPSWDEKTPSQPIEPTAECHLAASNSACELGCSVENHNLFAVRDVAVSFVGFLPYKTMVAGPADARITLEKSDTLPVPDSEGQMVREIRAFTIGIPLLPPTSNIPFTLWTDDQNNKNACEQSRIIIQKRHEILVDVFARLREINVAALPRLEILFSAIDKAANLFRPNSVISELGRSAVVFETNAESDARRRIQEIYSTVKERFNDVLQNRGECMAPVFTVEETGGAPVAFASLPPELKTNYTAGFRLPRQGQAIPEEGMVLRGRPVPPLRYECKPPQ